MTGTAPLALVLEPTVLGQVGLQDAGPGTAAGLAVARFATYLGLTLTVGFLLAAAALVPSGSHLSAAGRAATRRAALAAVVWAGAGAALAVFQLSTVAARPVGAALQADIIARFAGTRFGATVAAMVVAALVIAGVAALARTVAGSAMALTLAAAVTFAPVWWGHAGSRQDLRRAALASDWVHVLAAATWVGGLVALLWLARRDDVPLAGPLRRFSRLAGWALAAVLISGTVNALLNITAVDQLVDTTWGRLVLAKVALLSILVWFGYRHRTRVLPLAVGGDAERRRAFRRLAGVEAALMLVAFGLATGMASGIPAATEAALRVQSVYVAFGDGQLNLTVDPAEPGANVLHVYFLADSGQQRHDVTDPQITFTNGGDIVAADLFVAGPGHWTSPSLSLPTAGSWEVRVAAAVGADAVETTSAVTVR